MAFYLSVFEPYYTGNAGMKFVKIHVDGVCFIVFSYF